MASHSEYPLRWLGIDFSGNICKWSQGCTTSNVWIAEITEQLGKLRLDKLGTVQRLPGSDPPFKRLAARLTTGDFSAAAIDAPFSIPADFIPDGKHDSLLALVKRLSQPTRPFPDAKTFVDAVIEGRLMSSPKPLRRTEYEWQGKGVNTRSTLWAGPRGGAAMTASCLALLNETKCPLWPWRQYQMGIVAEAFPAAQLKTWQLHTNSTAIQARQLFQIDSESSKYSRNG
jgi:hypothetical protein